MKILIVDNFDSFTYNLSHYIEQFADKCIVVRNDNISGRALEAADKILLSPGPGLPHQVPVLREIIANFAHRKPILGVCLGHQAIAEAFGAQLFNLPSVVHGEQKNTVLLDTSDYLFNKVPKNFLSGRYHSWAVCEKNFPDVLKITATDNSNLIMALSHKIFDVKGVQFHPESVMTTSGLQIIKNWVLKH